jgi:hypothetical protein
MAAAYRCGRRHFVKSDIKSIAAAGILTAALAIVLGVADLSGARSAQVTGDFRSAAVAELHDGQGQVLLRGEFAPIDADDEGEVERLATLGAIAPGLTAHGEAEIEYQADTATEQEVEISVAGLAPGTAVTFVIDGKQIGSGKADRRGRSEFEQKVRNGS